MLQFSQIHIVKLLFAFDAKRCLKEIMVSMLFIFNYVAYKCLNHWTTKEKEKVSFKIVR